jgi:hydroxyacylglutathione hydrolase
VVDPRRDVEVYLEAAQRHGARITHILETHLHNDYVTGASELAARTNAVIVASAAAPPAYAHQAVRDGERFAVGELRVEVLATPGHTPEHVSYAVYAPGSATAHALFSGGSMLVGGAGRTDLLGPDLTATLTRQQYATLRRLLDTLPDAVVVYPTHGAGSFCVAGAVSESRHTTIGQERLASPAVHAHDAEEFARQQIAGYGVYPAYYAHMRPINQAGPRVLGALPEPPGVAPEAVQAQMAAGLPLVDSRNRDAFARAHVAGALQIELDDSFGTYAGWLLPFNAPLLLVVEDAHAQREAVLQLIRIGYERVEGTLAGGVAAWRAAGLPTGAFARIGIPELHERWQGSDPPAILDVRRDEEWRDGHIPGAQHIHIADLPGRVAEVPEGRTVAVVCASGYRASTGASILAAAGRDVIAVQGGVPGWLNRGYPSATGDDGGVTQDAATHAHP